MTVICDECNEIIAPDEIPDRVTVEEGRGTLDFHEDCYDEKSRKEAEEADQVPTVWRIRWDAVGLIHRTQWTIHYDVVRELYDDYRERWPGANVTMEAGKVAEVTDIRTMEFPSTSSGYKAPDASEISIPDSVNPDGSPNEYAISEDNDDRA